MSKLLQIFLCCIIIPVSLSGQGSGDTVRAIYVDDNNVKWFGSDLGLLSFDGTTWQAYNTQEETPGAVSSIMFENTASEFWVGTDDGVLLAGFDGNQFTSGSLFSNIEVDKHDQVRLNVTLVEEYDIDLLAVQDIITDAQQNVYIAMPNGVAVLRNQQWIWLESGYGIIDHGVPYKPLLAFGSEADTIYVASEKEGAGRLFPATLSLGYYNGDDLVITEDEIDGVSGASVLAPKYNIPFETNGDVHSIFTDSEGYQWFGTTEGIRKHTAIGSKEGWDLILSTADGLVNDTVYAIHEDSNGDFWFATNGGVSKYTGEYTNYTSADGLADKRVFDIAEDHNNVLWFATANGVSSFNGSTFTSYSTSEHAKDFEDILHVGLDFKRSSSNRFSIYPNPTTSHLYVHFEKDMDMNIDVHVYDMSGKMIRRLFTGYAGGGDLKVRWDLRNASNVPVPGGIYFISLETDRINITKKAVVIR